MPITLTPSFLHDINTHLSFAKQLPKSALESLPFQPPLLSTELPLTPEDIDAAAYYGCYILPVNFHKMLFKFEEANQQADDQAHQRNGALRAKIGLFWGIDYQKSENPTFFNKLVFGEKDGIYADDENETAEEKIHRAGLRDLGVTEDEIKKLYKCMDDLAAERGCQSYRRLCFTKDYIQYAWERTVNRKQVRRRKLSEFKGRYENFAPYLWDLFVDGINNKNATVYLELLKNNIILYCLKTDVDIEVRLLNNPGFQWGDRQPLLPELLSINQKDLHLLEHMAHQRFGDLPVSFPDFGANPGVIEARP